MELPRHIADMCGIMSEALERVPLSQSDYEVVKMIRDDDRTVQISWRDQVAGWVQDMPKDAEGRSVRALSVHGRLERFYTYSDAMEFVLSEMA